MNITIRLILMAGLILGGLGWHLTRPSPAWAAPEKSLDIYLIDVEGGAATLIVTPGGESVLIDSGWKREDDRDARRIHHVATQVAKLKQIDHSITTHWHMDHFGGIGRLSELMPIKNFYHHGIPDRLAEDSTNFPTLIADYKKASKDHSRVLRPGDPLPLTTASAKGQPSLQMLCVAAHGDTLPAKGSEPDNPLCKESRPKEDDPTDNARSIALLLSYGPFKFFDGGDMTWNVEKNLVCPRNPIGAVDVYQVNHHGMATSNNPVLVRSLDPRVALINNGPKKGGAAEVYAMLRSLPHIEAVYAVHRNVQTTEKDNPPAEFVANMEENCQGEFLKLSVDPNGKAYTVGAGAKGRLRRFTTR